MEIMLNLGILGKKNIKIGENHIPKPQANNLACYFHYAFSFYWA